LKALIFVYTNAQFRVSGTQPIRQFEIGSTVSFDDAPVAIEAGATGTLAQGIYVAYTDNDKEPPPIEATSGVPGTDYDNIVAASKDGWPVPKVTATQLEKIHREFPDLEGTELTRFTYSLSA